MNPVNITLPITPNASQEGYKVGGEMREYIFEIVDSSDEDAYYTIGIFKSLEEAVAAIESKPEPWQLCECAMFDGESAAMEIRKRKLGLAPLNTGDVVWSRKWVNEYDEETDDDKWRVFE